VALHLFIPCDFGLLFLFQSSLNFRPKFFWKFGVTALAQGLAVPRGEFTRLERFLARVAEEMVFMIRLVQELHSSFHNRFLTIRAVVSK